MSFFKLSTGETAAASTTFEMGGGDIEPIPKNTNVLAAVEEAKISEYQGEQTINLKWRVLKPEAYAKRVIFQKIKCWDTDKEKADKAVQMLAAIDANCGGKLMKSGAEPTDMGLQSALLNKPMVLNLQVWAIDDKKGNWIKSVSPAKAQAKAAPVVVEDDLEETLPF
ncbi:MAG TPA: hypothetical protein VIH30_11140 [Aquirhabdus sp.]